MALANARPVDEPSLTLWQHAVFCQIALPYEPTVQRVWQRRVGDMSLRIEAGSVADRSTAEGWREMPLPYGKNPRLILMHLSNEALRTGNPVVEVEDSMTAFAVSLGLFKDGRNIRELKAQLGNLAVATIRLSVGDTAQVNGKVVSSFDLWYPASPEQRNLWPSVVRLDADYFTSLQKHAVPLDRRAIAALQNSAAALDCYAWMAHTMHQIKSGAEVLVGWEDLWKQFGSGYRLLRQFRFEFKRDLALVAELYPDAAFTVGKAGVALRHSPPPMHQKLHQLVLPF